MPDIERLQRRLERERLARKSAESIAEAKTRQLYESNQELSELTERINKRSEDLREALSYLTAIIDNMADGLLVIDNLDRVKLINRAFLQMFHLDEKAIIDQNYTTVFDAQLLTLIAAVKTSDFSKNIRSDIEMPGNRIGRVVANPIIANDTAAGASSTLGIVLIIRDFTQEKEIDRVKTEFISNVSHELRTPLTSVLGFTKIIKKRFSETLLPNLDGNESPKVKRAIGQVQGNLDIIIAEGERLTNLINSVLDIAKMEAGKVDWHMAPVAIASVIERAVASTRSLFTQNAVAFKTEIDEDLPDVNVDQDRLIQVLVNLISNANKFTESGSVICKARMGEGEIIISVIDTGVGIAQDDLQQVFDKFKQVGNTLTDKPRGTGLGLPICKQIVEHHGGRIWADSTFGKGSTFSFSLPTVTAHETVKIPKQKTNIQTLLRQLEGQVDNNSIGTKKNSKRVLVVDDEPNIREYLRQELEGAGYSVFEAENGLDALGKTKELLPDLVILDVMMPMMNGFDAAAVLKNDPQTMDIPIVILSIIEDLERGYRIGINRYLKKPIEADVLLKEVANLVARKGSARSVLLINNEPQAISSLTETLQSSENTSVRVCSGDDCIHTAIAVKPDTIILDTSIVGYQDIEKALRNQHGLDDVTFILLGEG